MSLNQTDLLATISLINDTVGINTADQIERFWLKSQYLLDIKCLSVMVSRSGKQKDLAHANFLLFKANNTSIQQECVGWMVPIIQYGLLTNSVFSFEEAYAQYASHSQSSDFVETAKQHAMYNGYAIGKKTHNLSGTASVIAWVCNNQKANKKQEFMAKSILPHLNQALSNTSFVQVPTLSRRELDTLQQVKTGKTYSEIAEILHISIHTVNFHLKNIFQKLNVSNKTQALSSAMKLGLIEL